MKQLWIVGVGGLLGTLARYKFGGAILHRSLEWRFPIGTLAINVVGCFIAGVLAGLVEKHDWGSPALRLFLFTGLLGSFTTFSAFSLETITLVQRHDWGVALLNIGASLLGALLAFWCGVKLIPV